MIWLSFWLGVVAGATGMILFAHFFQGVRWLRGVHAKSARVCFCWCHYPKPGEQTPFLCLCCSDMDRVATAEEYAGRFRS